MKFFWTILLCAGSAFAQRGDKEGEVQAPPPPHIKIPPAPPLSVEEALKTFQLAPGFSIEVVASDPMIEAPVAIEFSPDGKMFVLEMRGFMRTVEGLGEDQPLGRISLLEDSNGDGKMDHSTIFVDGLIMPRAICVTRGGLLVAEPPNLWFFKDTNGDGKADQKTSVSDDYGNQKNPEHNSNGLIWGRDNWIYSANHTVRYKEQDGEWRKEPTTFRGQWGISQDDYGRLFFNSNSDQFRGDLVPTHYLARNPEFKAPFGGNVQIAKDQSTFPIRVNPGVNRGYQKSTLRPDGKLARFTGACGPVVYRGDLFPKEFYGSGFVCEPTANMIRCNLIQEKDGLLNATNAFPGQEFLASTDERFRPVNLFNGPDGALYIVDMYRGVIQHKIYLTTFLRDQALDRGLDKPLDMGRIYRVVPTNARRAPTRSLAGLSSAELVARLSAPNGWTRDTAQQLLVEKSDRKAVPDLLKLASSGVSPAAIHAMWVLHSMGETQGFEKALNASDSKVRATAVRVLEPLLKVEGNNATKSRILDMTNDPSIDARLQLMFSLGESKTAKAEQAMIAVLEKDIDHPLLRDAALTGLGGRELAFLKQLMDRPSWNIRSSARAEFLRDLAWSVAESREPARLHELLSLAAERNESWHQAALLDGILALIPPQGKAKEPQKPKPIVFTSEPPAISKLAARKELTPKVDRLKDLLVWPGKEGHELAAVKPLSASEQALFETGREQYAIVCGACHQPNGLGLDGLAPPLVDSPWANGEPHKLIRIALQGIRGPLNVHGKLWDLEMPALNILTDEEIAGLLTYVRREWGHTSPPISPEAVSKVRQETADRFEAWTEAELLKMK